MLGLRDCGSLRIGARRKLARSAIVAGSLVAAGAHVSGCGCTDIGCDDGVEISGPINLSSSDPARLSVQACRNGSCGTAVLSSDSIVAPSNVANATIDAGDGMFHCQLVNPGQGSAAWELDVTFAPGGAELEDGDRYVLSVVDTDSGREIVNIDEEVTYKESKPNSGAFCGPTCTYQNIPIPPTNT